MGEPHGILKHRPDTGDRGSIVWDEDNLILNERNKSSTMKIDEPPTPYHHPQFEYSDDEGNDSDNSMASGSSVPRSPHSPGMGNEIMDRWSELHEAVSSERERLDRRQDSDNEEDIPAEEEENKKEFSKKRKAHYNEYLMVKMAREQLNDDDDDEGGGDGRESQCGTGGGSADVQRVG